MDINQKQKERLEQQFAFIREIDKEKCIGRQTYLTDGERKENDAEHAWHMAIMTVLLAEYSNEPIDVLKTVTMLLIHDLVEIDAGDTYAYDEEAKKTQREQKLYEDSMNAYRDIVNAIRTAEKTKFAEGRAEGNDSKGKDTDADCYSWRMSRHQPLD